MFVVLVFKGFEFYNMTGIYVYFNDDAMEQVVHMQAWTMGIGETVSKCLQLDYRTLNELYFHFCRLDSVRCSTQNGKGCKLTVYRSDNHNDKSFCEVHCYLYNGGGGGTIVSHFHSYYPSLRLTCVVIALLRRYRY